MGRILGIDYGMKRTGIASTDPMKIIASPLTTVATKDLFKYLKDYCSRETVEHIVVGMPKDLYNRDTHSTSAVEKFIEKLRKIFPDISVSTVDERLTSKMAMSSLIEGGMKKKNRQEKGNVDMVSAAIILQSYLDSKTFL